MSKEPGAIHAEVRLGVTGGMGEWHEHLTRPKPLLTNVVLHDGVAARETVLVPEAVEDALRSVPLLAVAGPIVFQDPIDDSRERTQLWPPRRRASAIPWRQWPRTTASYGPSCGLHQTPARPRGCSSPRHDTPAEPVRTTPPDTSPPPSSQSNPDRRLYAVPFWSAAAGSTGRFSGGLLLCRSHLAYNMRRLVQPLSANLTETPAPLGITVGRWR